MKNLKINKKFKKIIGISMILITTSSCITSIYFTNQNKKLKQQNNYLKKEYSKIIDQKDYKYLQELKSLITFSNLIEDNLYSCDIKNPHLHSMYYPYFDLSGHLQIKYEWMSDNEINLNKYYNDKLSNNNKRKLYTDGIINY